MRHPQLTPILHSLRQYLDNLYGERLVSLILFGSQAKQEAQADSDIDILVVLKDDVDSWTENKLTGNGIAELCLDYSVLICCVFISETQFRSQETALLRNISREGVSV
jgi:uncharacterized protein